MENITGNIWSIRITLPDNPLKWLNSYVIRAEEGKNLLIDTGFNRDECREDLLAGIKAFGLTPENTDVFITHGHSDHSGNAKFLTELGYKIFMSRRDHRKISGVYWDKQRARMQQEGMPADKIEEVYSKNPARRFSAGPFEAEELDDGDILEYGGHKLECVWTPGHTPGHMCLYDRENEIMFLGDHVLFDISPNIIAVFTMNNTLGRYLDSLKKIKSYEIKVGLPAHRSMGDKTVQQRVDELLEHHRVRLEEAYSLIAENPGINAYKLSSLMTWNIRSRSWEDFPPSQISFAVGETLAHLDYLVEEGRIRQEECNGIVGYRVCD